MPGEDPRFYYKNLGVIVEMETENGYAMRAYHFPTTEAQGFIVNAIEEAIRKYNQVHAGLEETAEGDDVEAWTQAYNAADKTELNTKCQQFNNARM